jgi:hypothetical protein
MQKDSQMTLPNERTRALLNTHAFLRSLLDPKQTPKVPKAIRKEAYWCLRHYPLSMDIDELVKKAPNVLGKILDK